MRWKILMVRHLKLCDRRGGGRREGGRSVPGLSPPSLPNSHPLISIIPEQHLRYLGGAGNEGRPPVWGSRTCFPPPTPRGFSVPPRTPAAAKGEHGDPSSPPPNPPQSRPPRTAR